MDTLIHADIFFFITTIAVVVLGIILAVVLVRLAGLIKTIREISEDAKTEARAFFRDVSDLRQEVREEAGRVKQTLNLLHNFFPNSAKVGKRKIKKNLKNEK